MEFNPLLESLENQGVEAAYITLLRDLYNGATSTLKPHGNSDKINLQRGVRQGDNNSPKLFTVCLQDAIYYIKLQRPFICLSVCTPHPFSETTVTQQPNLAHLRVDM